ncbi:MAG: hypothetical protein AB1432_10640 [Bacteroidota bacterium]
MKKLMLFFLLTAIVIAKPYEPNNIDKQIINHTFNEEFDRAIKLSQDQIKINTASPKYHYYYINTKILEYYQKVAEIDPEKREAGRKVLNKEIIDYCENVLNKFDNSKLNTENKFYLGSIYAYLGRVNGLDGSWWSAFRNGQKSRNIMEEVLKADPKFYDAYLVLGMLYYYADRLSGITGFIAGVLGMTGDRIKGLEYLQLAYDKGMLTYGQTALTLIEIYSSLEDNDLEAIKYYEDFLKRYPRNKRTLNAYCHRLIGLYEFDKLSSIINSELIEDYTKARYYDAIGNTELAIRFAEESLKNEKSLWRGASGNAKYIIVFNSWLTGNSSLQKKYESELDERYKEIFETAKNFEKGSKWIHQFSIQAALGKSIAELESLAANKPDTRQSPELECRFNLMMGFFYFKNGILSKSETFYRKCLNSKNERYKYTAYKYLVDIYLNQNEDKSKVKKLLDDIEDFDNDRLTFRAKDLEKKYNL